MINVIAPYYYHGVGDILISERSLTTGKPIGYKDIGRVSSVTLIVKDNIIEHREHRTRRSERDFMLVRNSTVDIEMKVEQLNPENIAMFMASACEPVPAVTGYEMTQIVSPGFRYGFEHLNVDTVDIKSEDGSILYILDSNYKINAAKGALEILSGQPTINPITPGQTLLIKYNAPSQRRIEFGTEPRKEYCLRFEGLNIAESNSPVVIECYRVGFYLLNQFRVQDTKSSDLTVRGALMQDTLKPEGSQFFRELVL